MVANFWITMKGSLGNNDGEGNENGNETISCIFKTITLHLHHSFPTFFSHRCTSATWNFLISPVRFTELVNATQKVSFSLSKLRYGPFGFNLENFANIRQSEWNRIRSMKFETARIYFLSEFSGCRHPKVLLPWQRDETTSLYWKSLNGTSITRMRAALLYYILFCLRILFWGYGPFLIFLKIK